MRSKPLAGLLAALSLSFGLGGAARADTWLRAESPHFVVYAAGPEKMVRDYTLMLEDFDSLLRTIHRRPLSEPVTRKLNIYLVTTQGQLRATVPGASSDVAGVYIAGTEDIFAIATRNGLTGSDDKSRGDDVVLHEYVHHFLFQ